jgi:hypothetical protein
MGMHHGDVVGREGSDRRRAVVLRGWSGIS